MNDDKNPGEDQSANKKVDYDPTKIEVNTSRIKELPYSFFRFMKKLISIHDEVNPQATIKSIISEIEFKGSSIWILICSIVVASIGLNNNSTAVIIGAMLILLVIFWFY